MYKILAKTFSDTIGRGRFDPVSITALVVVAGAYGVSEIVKRIENKK